MSTNRSTAELQSLANAHLWGHFSKLTPEDAGGVVIIDRGEGCYVWDHTGKRYLDGLAGLFTVQAGHGRHELAQAAATGLQLVFTTAGKVGINNNGGPGAQVLTAASVSDGLPHSVVVTRASSGNTYTLYVDGALVGSNSSGTSPTYNRAFAFRRSDSTLPYGYYLHEASVANAVWDAATVASVYSGHRTTWGVP